MTFANGESLLSVRRKINLSFAGSYTELLANTDYTYTAGSGYSVSSGDVIETNDGGFWEVAASGASDHHATTAGGVKLYEAGPDFSTRARAVAAHARNVAAGRSVPAGTVWSWGEFSILFMPTGHALYGTDPISDLAGWVWNGKCYPDHFAENTTPGTTDMGTALTAWASAIGGGHGDLLPHEYATSVEVVIDTANTTIEAPAGAKIRQTTWGYSGVQVKAAGCSWTGGKVYSSETRSALSSAYSARYEGGLARTRSAAFYVQGDDFVVRDVETDGFVSDVRLTCDRIYRTGEDLTARTTTTTLVLNASDQEADDFYNGMLLDIQNATGPSEFSTRVITDYDNATNTITFSPAYSSAPSGADAGYLILTGRRSNITIEGLRNTGEVDFGVIDEWTDGLSVLDCSWDTITKTQGDTPHSVYLPGDPQNQRSRNVLLADLRTNYTDEGLAYKLRGIDGLLADNLSVDKGRGVLLFEQCANAQAETLNIRELGADYSGSAWAARISGGLDVSIKGVRATVSPTYTGSDVNAVEISNIDNTKLYAELDGYHVEDAVLRSDIGTSNNGSITLQAVRIERDGSTVDPATKRGVLTDISAIETSGDSVTTRAVFAEAYADDLLIFNPYAENGGGTLNPVRVNSNCANVLTIWNPDIQTGTNNISGATNREAYVNPGRQETYEPQGTGTTAHLIHNLDGGSSVQIRVDDFNSLGNVLRDRTAAGTGIWRVWSSGDDTTKFIGLNPFLMRMMIGGDLDITDSSANILFSMLTNGNFAIVSPTAPASASATGSAGEIAWDGSYLYVCTATDTWVRAGLATW